MDDTAKVKAFKADIEKLFEKHGLFIGLTVRGEMGIWGIERGPGSEADGVDVMLAADMTTQDRIDAYIAGRAPNLFMQERLAELELGRMKSKL